MPNKSRMQSSKIHEVVYPKRRKVMRHGYLIRNPVKAFIFALINKIISVAIFWKVKSTPKTDRMLIAISGHIGDGIVAFPMIERLRVEYPDSKIGILISPLHVDSVNGIRDIVDFVHVFDHPGYCRSPKVKLFWVNTVIKWIRFNSTLRIKSYQTVIDVNPYFPNWTPFLFFTYIPTIIGWKSGGFEGLQNHTVERFDSNRHVSDYPRDLLMVLDSKFGFTKLKPRYNFSGDKRNPFGSANDFILIHSGCGAELREWVDQEWRLLVQKLVVNRFKVVICGSGAKEEARASMMADGHGGDVLNLVNQLSWNDYVATMAAAAHVICLESSSQHLAAGLGIPMTVVYGGSTNWFQWGPGPVVANMVTHKTPCSVCNRSKCTHRNCIALVSSEEVFRAVYDKVGRETGL